MRWNDKGDGVEITQDELTLALLLVAGLDPGDYKHDLAKSLILKLKAASDDKKTLLISRRWQ